MLTCSTRQVLHYHNAIVSLQLQLLADEEDEEGSVGASSRLATVTAKRVTCPVFVANSASWKGKGAAKGQEGGDEKLLGDEWMVDRDAGVCVRGSDGRPVVYAHSLQLLQEVEEEVLRVATHSLERYTAQRHAGGRGSEASELDRTAILDDAWAFEAAFCEARHKVGRVEDYDFSAFKRNSSLSLAFLIQQHWH